MTKVVECIPNFSEGRDQSILAGLKSAAAAVPGCALLDVHTDIDHNRSVFTLAGSPQAIEEAAFQLVKQAGNTIDLTKHRGAHPRMGATDVLPFVPLSGSTMQECVDLSKRVAQRIWEELQIPSFLYEQSASAPHRRNLADVRRGEFEGMNDKMKQPEWAPDYGTPLVHPTAGITAIGARMPLIAFNVNLNTDNVDIAKAIAKAIRGSSGGFAHCKALGILLKDKGMAQVSMNMVNYEGTPLYRVFEAIRFEAKRWGVSILSSELVGMAPAKAFVDTAAYYLQLENYNYQQQVLEHHLLEAKRNEDSPAHPLASHQPL